MSFSYKQQRDKMASTAQLKSLRHDTHYRFARRCVNFSFLLFIGPMVLTYVGLVGIYGFGFGGWYRWAGYLVSLIAFAGAVASLLLLRELCMAFLDSCDANVNRALQQRSPE
jgi:hypothetical protein